MTEPELSAILVVGACRSRAQQVLHALSRQTAIERMEIVVVDLAPLGTPRLLCDSPATVRYLDRPKIERWGEARFEALREARAPVAAFIEDHCCPRLDWAEYVLRAHAGPWAAVGYAFVNANPESYVSRAGMLARYGLFAHPASGGSARYISGNNVSYKRAALDQLGDEQEALLDIDFNLHEALLARGEKLFVEARALAAHQNYTRLSGECRTGRPYCRLLAARRARGWRPWRRMVYGLLSPVAAPTLRLARLLLSLRGRRSLWRDFVAGLPAIVVMYVSDAIGEASGYLAGEGDSQREVLRWELETERAEK